MKNPCPALDREIAARMKVLTQALNQYEFEPASCLFTRNEILHMQDALRRVQHHRMTLVAAYHNLRRK